MQIFPEPPKSYSLIKNLLPSVSLFGQTSQVQYNNFQSKQRPQITSEVNEMIEVIESATMEELKQVLKQELPKLQSLSITRQKSSLQQLLNSLALQDPILMRLKQLKLVSNIMMGRMNEKQIECRRRFQELRKVTGEKNKVLGIKGYHYWKRVNKTAKNQKIEESQSTEKKGLKFGFGENDLKKTKKQEEKEKEQQVKCNTK